MRIDLVVIKKLSTHLNYRDKHNVAALAELPARKLFNSAAAQLAYSRQLPHGLLGRDHLGQPVLYKHCGKLNVTQLARGGAGGRPAYCLVGARRETAIASDGTGC